MIELPQRLREIMAQDYPRFSDGEYARRHAALAALMQPRELDHLLVVTDHRTGNAPQWVTGWPGTVEAYVIFKPGEKMTMHVEWYNHFPLARRIARDCDVRWGEHRGIEKTVEELKRRGAKRVGLIGPLLPGKKEKLADFQVVHLDAEYVRLRLIKSEEEVDWLRIGAAFSDLGFQELLTHTRPGMTERELGNLVERAYVGEGGTTFIHYIGVTSMANPHLCVPPQFHSSRKVQAGDVVFCELSGSWWDYSGQVLRSYTVGADPTPLYRDLHKSAEDAFDAVTGVVRHGTTMDQVLDAAASAIEARGFSVYDDLMHGFGGGYFPPIVGSRSRPAGPLPQMTLEENMTVVVQPNVITRDQKAGVQVGELIRVTKSGFERLHSAPRGFFRV